MIETVRVIAEACPGAPLSPTGSVHGAAEVAMVLPKVDGAESAADRQVHRAAARSVVWPMADGASEPMSLIVGGLSRCELWVGPAKVYPWIRRANSAELSLRVRVGRTDIAEGKSQHHSGRGQCPHCQ